MIPIFSDDFAASTSCRPLSSILSDGKNQQETQTEIMIQRSFTTLESASFDWSDFPILERNEDTDRHHHHFHRRETFHLSNLQQQYQQYFDSSSSLMEDTFMSPLQEEDASSMGLSSCSSDGDFSIQSATSFESACSNANKNNNRTSSKKNVSFSTHVEVRTHSIVLGDHPCCPSLALELGWEHGETQLIHRMDYGHEQHVQRSPTKQRFTYRHTLRRRSYLERKALLKLMTGMSEAELIQKSNKMKPSAPSSRQLCQLV